MAKALTVYQKQLRAVSEREWQNLVISLAQGRGWKHYHPPDNKPVNGRIQKVVAGFPDLVLVKGDRLAFVELKRETGKVSPEQVDWLASLRATGAECYVWRPSMVAEAIKILDKKP